jgi:hypothetical protein
MTIDDYMNAERFPMTSQKGYSPDTQLRMDAFNLDDLQEAIEMGHKMNAKEAAVFQELKTKEPHIGRLVKELRQAEVAQQSPNASTPSPFKMTSDEVLDLIRRNRSILQEESNNANIANQFPASGTASPCNDHETDRSV